jgi:hypothetical protein
MRTHTNSLTPKSYQWLCEVAPNQVLAQCIGIVGGACLWLSVALARHGDYAAAWSVSTQRTPFFGAESNMGAYLVTVRCRPNIPDGNGESASISSSREHLNSVDGHDADVTGEGPIRLDKRSDNRTEILRSCGVNPEQNDAGLCQRDPTLNCDLPEVLIERQNDACFEFGQVQKDCVFPSSAISAGPKDVVAIGTKCLDDLLRKVLVCEEAHLHRNRKCLVFVGQVAGVR